MNHNPPPPPNTTIIICNDMKTEISALKKSMQNGRMEKPESGIRNPETEPELEPELKLRTG